MFELKDFQGKALSGKNVEITYNGNEKYSVTTDQNGKGYLTISGEDAGKYEIEVKYAGDDKYNGGSARDTITITMDVPDNTGTQTGGNSVATTEQYNNNTNTDKKSDDNDKKSDSVNTSRFTANPTKGDYWMKIIAYG